MPKIMVFCMIKFNKGMMLLPGQACREGVEGRVGKKNLSSACVCGLNY